MYGRTGLWERLEDWYLSLRFRTLWFFASLKQESPAAINLRDVEPSPAPNSSTILAPGFEIRRRDPIVLQPLTGGFNAPARQTPRMKAFNPDMKLVVGKSLGNVNPAVYEKIPGHAPLELKIGNATQAPLAATGTDSVTPDP
jgi:hypothetical protein